MKDWFLSLPDQVFQTRQDPRDPRLGDIRALDMATADNLLWGYPDDEGIQLSGGRLGAAEGPLAIRKLFYKLTLPLDAPSPGGIFDVGQLKLQDLDVQIPQASRHQRAREFAVQATQSGKLWAALGGGHDYGYSDGSGFVQAILDKGLRPLILNFDAHLDVRPLDRGLTSGTPFFRILEEFQGKFDFFEIGIQPHCNAQAHANYVRKMGGKIISLAGLRIQGARETLVQALTPFHGRPTFLSVDIDVFASDQAPGCSQSWPGGLTAQEFFPAFAWLLQNLQIQGLGIYEVSPPLDLGLQTQRLGALILYEFFCRNPYKPTLS